MFFPEVCLFVCLLLATLIKMLLTDFDGIFKQDLKLHKEHLIRFWQRSSTACILVSEQQPL